MTLKIPGLSIKNSVSVTAQYTLYLRGVGSEKHVPPMRVTFTAETETSGDLESYQTDLESTITQFNGHVVLSVDNAMLLQYLEPKNGATVQTLYASLKDAVNTHALDNRGIGYAIVGNSVPTMTKMGILLFVTNIEPSLEYMAALVLSSLPWATSVRASSDAGLEASVTWDEQPVLI